MTPAAIANGARPAVSPGGRGGVLAHRAAGHIILLTGKPGRQKGITKVRRSIAAACATAVLSTTGALVLPAAASAHDASHTLNMSVTFTKTAFGFQETDVSSMGKTIGFDDGYVTLTGKQTATVNAAIDTRGGFLYVRFATTNGFKTIKGKVT